MWVQQILTTQLSKYLDQETFLGTGTSNRIKGLINRDNLQTVEGATNGTALSLARVLSPETTLLNSNLENVDNLAWIIPPSLRERAASTLAFAVNGSRALFQDNMLNQRKTCVSTTVPYDQTKGSDTKTANAVLLLPSALAMVTFSAPTISVNTYDKDFWTKNVVGYKISVVADMGMDVRGAIYLKHTKTTA